MNHQNDTQQQVQEVQKKNSIKKLKIFLCVAGIILCVAIALSFIFYDTLAAVVKYNYATILYGNEQYEKAAEIFRNLDYKDSEDKAVEADIKVLEIKCTKQADIQIGNLKNITIGDFIKFGFYDLDGKVDTLDELEWQVLDIQDNKALLISKYAVNEVIYGVENVTWETCKLREQLNEDFYDLVFTDNNKNRILMTNVTADSNPKYSTNPGRDTQDKIFLLSIKEIKKYFPTDEARKCSLLPELEELYDFEVYGYFWWSRTPGRNQRDVAGVNGDGTISYDGEWADSGGHGWAYIGHVVRPAMWVKVD